MDIITSSQNPLIKEIKALKTKKYRDKNKIFFIEGIKFVEEAIKYNAEIIKVLVSEKFLKTSSGNKILSLINFEGCEVFLLSQKLFNEVSDTENPQGIMAIIKQNQSLLNTFENANNFYLILDTIQDPGNLGTIIRTADAAGVTGVILSKGCVDLYNPKVLRATMGSIFHLPVFFSEDIIETISNIRSKGIKIIAAFLNGSVSCFEMDAIDNIAVIIGNEANGISEELAAQADLLVKIPMPGKAESLNASIAAALIMFEVVRFKDPQRGKTKK